MVMEVVDWCTGIGVIGDIRLIEQEKGIVSSTTT